MSSKLSLHSPTEETARVFVEALGISLPRQIAFTIDETAGAAAEAWDCFPGRRVVLKIVRPGILHKSDIGGVAVVEKSPEDIADAVERMAARTGSEEFVVCEMIEHDLDPGGEILLNIRHTEDFGPVVSLGLGGVGAELFARGAEIAVFSPHQPARAIRRELESKTFAALIRGVRNQRPHMTAAELADLVRRSLAFSEHMPATISELEINPLVPTPRGLFALDVVVRQGVRAEPRAVHAPHELTPLLRPRSVAVAGVSKSRNPGRIIVDHLRRDGFDLSKCWIVKPDEKEIDGIGCVPAIGALPERVDLLVLSIAAEQIPAAIDETIDGDKAAGVIVIPGGVGERPGSEPIERRIRESLEVARHERRPAPVVNGGNCLGILSRPARCNTIFLPDEKLEAGALNEQPLAIVSQSGALAAALATRLAPIAPRYLVSFGNQIDVTAGDYLGWFAQTPDVEVAAFYIEGFQRLDGIRWLAAAEAMAARGGTVILYRGGRTPAGALATRTHTAAIAGDAVVTRELAASAGVLVAESLEEFEDLIRLATFLRRRRHPGCRLGAMSNAGFECVAFADNIGAFALPALGRETEEQIAALLRQNRLEKIVTVRNPLDVNPMLGDAAFAAVAEAMLADDGIDIGIIGCVPLTGALRTLPAEIADRDSIVSRLGALWHKTTKPWVCVVDAGPLYDPMALALTAAGIPTFRSADRALRAIGKLVAWRTKGSDESSLDFDRRGAAGHLHSSAAP